MNGESYRLRQSASRRRRTAAEQNQTTTAPADCADDPDADADTP